MGAASSSPAANLTGVRVVVIGDPGTGKSSLHRLRRREALQFPDEIDDVPRVVPLTCLPAEFFPDRVPITIVDTSSRLEDRKEAIGECVTADAVVLTYCYDSPATMKRAWSFWLPELRRLKLTAPVILVGCKMDLVMDEQQQASVLKFMAPIMYRFPEIEACIGCSALRQIQVREVFYYAQKAVLHPIAPLFHRGTQSME